MTPQWINDSARIHRRNRLRSRIIGCTVSLLAVVGLVMLMISLSLLMNGAH